MKLTVRGSDIRKKPLLETDEARSIEMRDNEGELVAILHKMYDSEVWGLTTKNDKDWESAKMHLGYTNPATELEASKREEFFNI